LEIPAETPLKRLRNKRFSRLTLIQLTPFEAAPRRAKTPLLRGSLY
jgi:hypothetical protein